MKPLLLVGEAPGAEEDRISSSFVGPSGIALLHMLDEAGVISLTAVDQDLIRKYYNNSDASAIDTLWRLHPEVHRANVFNTHPPANDITFFCGPKESRIPGLPILKTGNYVRQEFAYELQALQEKIDQHDPNLIVSLGNTPLWALCGVTKISTLRGSTRYATHIGKGRKVLPMFHPAAVLREWSLRPVTILDLKKANREKSFPDLRRPAREVWIEPGLSDIRRFIDEHVKGCNLLSVDIETSGKRVTCIGFATSPTLALVVPFDDSRNPKNSYWTSLEDEVQAWALIREMLLDRTVPKVFHNALYDVPFILRSYGIPTYAMEHDSMLCHHAMMPEMKKGLGFLGSLYCDFGAWKSERRVETIKNEG